jgi:hypothetical protein
MRGVIFHQSHHEARRIVVARPGNAKVDMKSACFSWVVLLLVIVGCSSDDAPGDPPDAAALDAAAPDAAALDAAALDAAALDATAPDAAPVPCEDRYLPVRIDSVVMGSTPPSQDIDDIVTWQDGEDVQLIYGDQGSLMLVAEVIARGSGLTMQSLSYSLVVSLSSGGEDVSRQPYNAGFDVADDGSWRREQVSLPFEIDLPEEGEALVVTLNFGCFDIQRTIIAHLPEE